MKTVRAVCPHDCPDTCAMLVNVDDDGRATGVRGDLDLQRQFLHAHRLRFAHPVTGAELDLESPLPGELRAALERARGM